MPNNQDSWATKSAVGQLRQMADHANNLANRWAQLGDDDQAREFTGRAFDYEMRADAIEKQRRQGQSQSQGGPR